MKGTSGSPGWRAAVAFVILFGVVLTSVVSWAAYAVDRHSERRLLEFQTRQAANGVAAAIAGIVAPLRTVGAVAVATNGDATQVQQAAGPAVGAGKTFAGLAVLKKSGSGYTPLLSTGAPRLGGNAPQVQALVRKAAEVPASFAVDANTSSDVRILYAIVAGRGAYVVYAERAIPANRRVEVESTSAFAGLHFASYFGGVETPATLQTTDLPDSELPIHGSVVRISIPFGTRQLLLVTSAAHRLGGGLQWALWWLIAIAGGVATVVAAVLVGALARRRVEAERNARTIALLYDEVNTGYAQQRDIAETLQRALLPQYNPDLPGVELATHYVAGSAGVQIGGDWFSVVRTGTDTFGFVVGDVSGRGLAAAVVMARLRFSVRAYLLEGHPPDVILGMCSHDLDIRRDEHMATVLVGSADLTTGEVRLASAGHLSPLLVTADGARPLPVRVGPPLGVGPSTYPVTTAKVPPGATLLAYTDGLVERRDEPIDDGVQRLARAANPPRELLDAWLRYLLDALRPEGSEDDIALLALRWAAPAAARPSGHVVGTAVTPGR